MGAPPTGAGSERWNPWAALRARPDLQFRLDPVAGLLGGGFYARRGRQRAIVLDPSLSRRRRRTALAHELVHDERGIAPAGPDAPPGLAVIEAREERAVDDEVARRLVPLAELQALGQAQAELGEALHAWQVADEFDVDDDTARRALRLAAEAA